MAGPLPCQLNTRAGRKNTSGAYPQQRSPRDARPAFEAGPGGSGSLKRFCLGEPPQSDGLSRDSDWTPVTMPEVRRWQLLAFPVALANMAAVAGPWLLLTPAVSELRVVAFPVPVLGLVACLLGVLVVHEFVHSWVHPGLGFSNHSVIGFYPLRMLLYCVYNGELSRGRFLAVLAMPLAVISLVPLAISAMLQAFPFWLAYASVLNAFVAAGDVMESATVARQVPAGATIRRSGWSYYWRPG